MGFLLTVLAVVVGHYVNGLLFVLFKANKYENTLVNKISKEVDKRF